jgi:hypothetical protein
MQTGFAAIIESERRVDRALFSALVLWMFAWVTGATWRLFCGSGYAEVAPEPYRLSVTVLLSVPQTANDAKQLLERDGYISIVDQHRLMQRVLNKCR